ncbi:MAG: hypothetical protein QOJ02_1212 [Acidobacteriota bacterium]|jgi:hypothetical protein|nr:hypothetical protein [Acidobacteriota bacterium]
MAMRITYPDGSIRLIPEAVRVDEQNFHEGMYDFYDSGGSLLEQIDMHSKISWELVDEPTEQAEEIPLFLRDSSEGQKGNAQDEKDEMAE